MDFKGHARAKALTKIVGLLAATALMAYAAFQARAQQPVQTTRNRISTQPVPAHSSNFPGNDIQQLLSAGQAALDQGRFEEAIRTYNRIITLSVNQPRTASLANLKIGSAYMIQRKFENAAIAFQRAVTLNPADADSYNILGEALGELKQYPRALELF